MMRVGEFLGFLLIALEYKVYTCLNFNLTKILMSIWLFRFNYFRGGYTFLLLS